MKRLTVKQMAFVIEFVANGGNASAAYRVAYNTARMKAATIKKRASELMGNGDIRGTINKMMDDEIARLKQKYRVDNDTAMEEYSCIAFSDIRKLFDKNGKLLPIDQIDPDTARAIASIEVVTNNRRHGEETFVEYTHKIKMLDKLGALRDIAKMLGLFKEGVPDDKPPVTVNNQINVPEALGRLYPSPAILPGECDKDQ